LDHTAEDVSTRGPATIGHKTGSEPVLNTALDRGIGPFHGNSPSTRGPTNLAV